MYCISSRGEPTRDDPLGWELGEGLTTPHRKNPACYETLHRASAGSCEYGENLRVP